MQVQERIKKNKNAGSRDTVHKPVSSQRQILDETDVAGGQNEEPQNIPPMPEVQLSAKFSNLHFNISSQFAGNVYEASGLLTRANQNIFGVDQSTETDDSVELVESSATNAAEVVNALIPGIDIRTTDLEHVTLSTAEINGKTYRSGGEDEPAAIHNLAALVLRKVFRVKVCEVTTVDPLNSPLFTVFCCLLFQQFGLILFNTHTRL